MDRRVNTEEAESIVAAGERNFRWFLIAAGAVILMILAGFWIWSRTHAHNVIVTSDRQLGVVGSVLKKTSDTVAAHDSALSTRREAEIVIDSSLKAVYEASVAAHASISAVEVSEPSERSDSLRQAVSVLDTQAHLEAARGDSLARDTADLAGEKKALNSALVFTAKDDSAQHGIVKKQAVTIEKARSTEIELWIATIAACGVAIWLILRG